jgi:hypothetical protein
VLEVALYHSTSTCVVQAAPSGSRSCIGVSPAKENFTIRLICIWRNRLPYHGPLGKRGLTIFQLFDLAL